MVLVLDMPKSYSALSAVTVALPTATALPGVPNARAHVALQRLPRALGKKHARQQCEQAAKARASGFHPHSTQAPPHNNKRYGNSNSIQKEQATTRCLDCHD